MMTASTGTRVTICPARATGMTDSAFPHHHHASAVQPMALSAIMAMTGPVQAVACCGPSNRGATAMAVHSTCQKLRPEWRLPLAAAVEAGAQRPEQTTGDTETVAEHDLGIAPVHRRAVEEKKQSPKTNRASAQSPPTDGFTIDQPRQRQGPKLHGIDQDHGAARCHVLKSHGAEKLTGGDLHDPDQSQRQPLPTDRKQRLPHGKGEQRP